MNLDETNVTASDFFTNNQDGIPSIEKLLGRYAGGENSYRPLPLSERVDLDRFASESWSGSQSFNPDAAKSSLSFTSGSGAKVVGTLTQSASASGYAQTASFTVTGATSGSPYTNKVDRLTGSFSVKEGWTARNTTTGVKTGTFEESKSYTDTDSQGTSGKADDVSISVSFSQKGSYKDTYLEGVKGVYTLTSTSAGNIKYSSGLLNLEMAQKGTNTYEGEWSEQTNWNFVTSKNWRKPASANSVCLICEKRRISWW